MKRIILLLFCVFSLTLVANAFVQDSNGDLIPLRTEHIHKGPIAPPIKKSTTPEPEISIKDHTLHFYDIYYQIITIQIIDMEDNIVYETILPIGSNDIQLPKTLQGNYNIKIYNYNEDFCFTGKITL
jgi:hypothetical protein